jgi:hypothetical protein
MSVNQTNHCGASPLMLLAVAILPIFMAAAPAGPRPSTSPSTSPPVSPRVMRFLGTTAADILARADRIEVLRVRSKRAAEGAPSVGGYAIVAAGATQPPSSARRVADLLLDEKSYRFDHNTVGGFTPLVGLRLWAGDKSVEVLLSPATDEAVVFSRNPGDGVVRSAQADVAPARGALVLFVKEALPELARDGALN